MNAVSDEELKLEIAENADDLAVALAFGVTEKRVKKLRAEINAALAAVPPAKTPAEILAEEEQAKAAKERAKAAAEASRGKRFLLRDPATGMVTELKQVNSSCDIVLLTR